VNTPPDRRAVASATFVAALLSGVPSTTLAVAQRDDVLAAVKGAATMVPLPVHSTAGAVAVGGAVHAAISTFWAVVLSRVLPAGRRLPAGAAAGAAIYVLDMEVVARLLHLDGVRSLSRLGQLADHVAFGALVGWMLDRRAIDRDQAAGSTANTG
jgi:hypothetical protein